MVFLIFAPVAVFLVFAVSVLLKNFLSCRPSGGNDADSGIRIRGEYGKEGERIVSELLSTLSGDYSVYNDIMLRGATGTVQIDHIVVSVFGIFVIETKNYKGALFGRDGERTWRKIFRGAEKTFYNPVMQNRSHVSALKLASKIRSDQVFVPVVAFSDDADISGIDAKFLDLKSAGPVVLNFSDLLKKISLHQKRMISETQSALFCACLERSRIDSEKFAERHARNVKRSVSERGFSEYGNCPECGSRLILRNGRRGYFLGCENYPSCRYTRELEE